MNEIAGNLVHTVIRSLRKGLAINYELKPTEQQENLFIIMKDSNSNWYNMYNMFRREIQ